MKFEYVLVYGNHDDRKQYLKYIGRDEKLHPFEHRRLENIDLIFLDSSSSKLDTKQIGWLKNVLPALGKVMIFIHHPILECIETILDKKYPLGGRRKIQNILKKHPDEIVIFSGHYHTEYFRQSENITQYITPATSAQISMDRNKVLFDTKYIGFRVIEMDKDAYATHIERIYLNNPTAAIVVI